MDRSRGVVTHMYIIHTYIHPLITTKLILVFDVRDNIHPIVSFLCYCIFGFHVHVCNLGPSQPISIITSQVSDVLHNQTL